MDSISRLHSTGAGISTSPVPGQQSNVARPQISSIKGGALLLKLTCTLREISLTSIWDEGLGQWLTSNKSFDWMTTRKRMRQESH